MKNPFLFFLIFGLLFSGCGNKEEKLEYNTEDKYLSEKNHICEEINLNKAGDIVPEASLSIQKVFYSPLLNTCIELVEGEIYENNSKIYYVKDSFSQKDIKIIDNFSASEIENIYSQDLSLDFYKEEKNVLDEISYKLFKKNKECGQNGFPQVAIDFINNQNDNYYPNYNLKFNPYEIFFSDIKNQCVYSILIEEKSGEQYLRVFDKQTNQEFFKDGIGKFKNEEYFAFFKKINF